MQKLGRIIILLAFAVGVFFPTAKVYASNLHLSLGADYINSDIKYRNHKKEDQPKGDFHSVAPVIALSAYGIGLEAFIFNSDSVKEDSFETKLKAYGISVFGEANLSDNFSVIASLGMAEYKFQTKKDNLRTSTENNGPRIGIGLQYYLTGNLAIRGMYHYTLLNSGENDEYQAVSEFTAGIRLIF